MAILRAVKTIALLATIALLSSCGLNEEYVARQFAEVHTGQLEKIAASGPNHVQRRVAQEELARRKQEAIREGIASGEVRKSYVSRIQAREVALGMNELEVSLSWGVPTRVNRTISEYGSMVQWVYDYGNRAQYVHFRGGRVSYISG